MDRAIKFGIIFLIIYCPLAFGSVHIFSFTLMEITVLGLLVCWLMKQLFSRSRKGCIGLDDVAERAGTAKRAGMAREREWAREGVSALSFLSEKAL